MRINKRKSIVNEFSGTIRKSIILGLVLIFLFLNVCCIPKVIAGEKNVIVIRSQKIAAYNEAIKGFEEGCKGQGISIRTIYDMEGDIDEGKKVIQYIKNDIQKPDLIITVGILATVLVKEQFPDIPIIFCMVVNHKRFDLHEPNITGISSDASVEDQLALMKELLGTKKKIGVIYDPIHTGKIVSEAAHIAEKLGLELIKKEVTSETEVASVLKSIITTIHAFWILPDDTVVTKDSLSTICKLALRHRLPTFCTSNAIVKQGAMLSLSPDYTSIGLQAARMAKALLITPKVVQLNTERQEKPVYFPDIEKPDRLKITVNTQTVKDIGLDMVPLRSYPDVVFYPEH